MADDILTFEEKAKLAEVAELIVRNRPCSEPPCEEWEGALVAAYDHLIENIYGVEFLKPDRMVLLSLFPFNTDADDSSESQKAAGVEVEELTGFEAALLRAVVASLPGEYFSRFMLLTWWDSDYEAATKARGAAADAREATANVSGATASGEGTSARRLRRKKVCKTTSAGTFCWWKDD